MLVQRRHAQRTAFVWAVSLNGVPVELHVMNVTSAAGEHLDESDALLVQVSSGGRNWSLLANPGRKQVNVVLGDGSRWQTDVAFGVR